MKKLLNAPGDLVVEALKGMATAEPSLRVDPLQRLIFRAEPKPAGRVALVLVGLGVSSLSMPPRALASVSPQEAAGAAARAASPHHNPGG